MGRIDVWMLLEMGEGKRLKLVVTRTSKQARDRDETNIHFIQIHKSSVFVDGQQQPPIQTFVSYRESVLATPKSILGLEGY